jgi:hypothetical protein
VADVRWKQEREEVIELVYRVQADHGGNLSEREARKLGPWAPDAIKRAKNIHWLVAKGSPPMLSVTKKGSKALDAALASRNVAGPQPHWFGGSIPSVESPTGSVLPPQSYKQYEELKQWALENGILREVDIKRIASTSRKEPEEPVEDGSLQHIFPGTRGFAIALQYEEKHPLGGGMLHPAGYEGAYEVTATLTRRGAPDVPFVYVTDPSVMEGDSHLWLPEMQRENGADQRLRIIYSSSEGEDKQFELRANRHGRLGQIRTILRAKSVDDARKEAYRLLNPILSDLSYRQDIPIEVLQTNVVELATLTMGGMKEDDFPEQVFDPEQFLGSGLAYDLLPNYEFFTRLYRDGVNSHSVDYGFLCFFRIAEGLVFLRRKRRAKEQGRSWKKVPWADVFMADEIIEGKDAEQAFFSKPELLGESILEPYESLNEDRVKVAHAFLNEEDPIGGHADIIADRLEGERDAASRRAQARYIARRLMRSEFFEADEPASEG